MTRTWRVGELASSTGLTVRTLHHWDHVGLLRPSGRTSAGHRIYTDRDVDRLYRIVVLRDLGLPLESIAGLLGGDDQPDRAVRHGGQRDTSGDDRSGPQPDGTDLGRLLADHLAHVERQLTALDALRNRLAALVAMVRAATGPTTPDLLALIEEVNRVDDTIRNYFTPEQLASLEQRRAQLGEDAIRETQQAWPALIAEMQAELDAGTDPTDPKVRALAQRWMGLLEAFHGGDPGLRDSLYKMQAENSSQISQQYGGPSPELIDYVRRATAN